VSETIGDLLREGLALVGYVCLLFWYDAGLALVCFTAAPVIVYPLVRLGQKVRRSTKRSQEHLETLSHVATERSRAIASSRRSGWKRARRAGSRGPPTRSTART
jgi:ABC-type multidrug transport system fused ATPase/permease subunit